MLMPLVVKATFMLSGMLGLKIEGLVDEKGNPRAVDASVPFNMTNGNQTVMVEMISNQENELSEIKKATCGPGVCIEKEVCVTWTKEKDNSTRKSGESPMMIHECLPDDGNHYTKMDPTGAMLCSDGEIPSIIRESQPYLKDNPPCNLVWKYKCLNQTKNKDVTTHSCKLKMCPRHSVCLELVECDLNPPCVTKAICIIGGHVI